MKRTISFFLCVIIFATSILPVYAAGSFANNSEFNPIFTDVEEDLSKFYFDNVPFDAADYPVDNSTDQMRLITIYEYGYLPREAYIDRSDASECESYYELFFYVYNPSCLTVKKNSTRASVQLSLSNALEYGYHKFDLLFIDQSDDGRFLKFCLQDYEFPDPYPDNGLDQEHFSFYLGDTRKYFVSGMQIETKEKGLVDYTVANDYTFTGSCFDGTLEFTNHELTVLKLDVNSTFYRSETSSKGWGFQNQLDSVYFAVPNSVLEYYGNVNAIHFETTKKRVNGIVSESPYMHLFSWKAQNGMSLKDYSSFVDTNKKYGLEDLDLAWYSLRLQNDGIFSILPALGWNARAEKHIDYIFHFKFGHVDSTVSGEEIIEYLRKYDLIEKTLWIEDFPLQEQPFVAPIKSETVSPWIYVDDRFDLLSYDISHSIFEKLWDYGFINVLLGNFGDDSRLNIKAIIPVTSSDLVGSDQAIADKLMIDVNDVDELKDYVVNNPDSTTYLFRFAQQDYYAEDVFVYDYNDPAGVGVGPGPSFVGGTRYQWEDVTADGYYWEQTAYLDFDILELQFVNDRDCFTTLPVVSSPIDIIGDATAPFVPSLSFLGIKFDTVKENRGSIMAILLVIALIVFVVWLIFKIKNNRRRGRRSGTVVQVFTGDRQPYQRRRRR